MKTLVVVQARTGSTRLPGKVLLPLAGRPMLERMLARVFAARPPFDIVVATTTCSTDDGVVEAATRMGVRVFRGHETDLLDRHYRAALESKADVVVKIPSDCPLVDPAAIARVLDAHWSSGADYTSNLHPATWPDGTDVEAISMHALAIAWREAKAPHEREHTTPFLWEHPNRFRTKNVESPLGDHATTHRLVVDYAEDYDVVRAVFEALWTSSIKPFSIFDAVVWLDENPRVRERNAKYRGASSQLGRASERPHRRERSGSPASGARAEADLSERGDDARSQTLAGVRDGSAATMRRARAGHVGDAPCDPRFHARR